MTNIHTCFRFIQTPTYTHIRQDGGSPELPPDIHMLSEHEDVHAELHDDGVYQLRSSDVVGSTTTVSDGPTADIVGLPFGVSAPDVDRVADGGDVSGGGLPSEHHRTDAVPMLIGSHDDDDGGGGDSCDMFNMSDFRQFCCDNANDDGRGVADDTGDGRKAHRISLSCLDEPLPQALHSLLMELDGAEPDLEALICGGDIGSESYRLNNGLADSWSD